MKNNIIEGPFDLENVEILSSETHKIGQLIITIKSTFLNTTCHFGQEVATELHGYADVRTIRQTSVLGLETYIRFYPKRSRCHHCGKITTQQLSGCEPYCHHTRASENQIWLGLVNRTGSDVAIKENLSAKEVPGIIDRHIGQSVDWDSSDKIELLGIDEISRKKGHKDFLTIITARTDGKPPIWAVLGDRQQDTVNKFLKTIPKRLRKTIKAVCSDMYEGFVNAAKEVLKVKVGIDRFHLAKLYRKSLDYLRKSEMKRLKQELSEAQYQELKNVRWILRKNPSELDYEKRVVLILWFKYSPLLELAYQLTNELTCIFDQDISRLEAKRKVKTWIKCVKKSKLTCFDRFLATLNKGEKNSLNYFDDRYTSGFIEGLNNQFKVIKRRCSGIFNIGPWFQRIYLDMQGYSLFA